jgi:formylglycine-generating enzyme required for sulfatase activity
MMGCTKEQEEDCKCDPAEMERTYECEDEQCVDYCEYDDEKPAHSVTLSDYRIGKYEVTQRLWIQIMGTYHNSLGARGDNLPVELVSWDDVQIFIAKLNSRTGKKYRLPTEAEWEYAARGGNKSKGYKYSGSDNIDDVAWYIENSDVTSSREIQPVGTKRPNELGIYDMSGNISEWVNDRRGDYTAEPKTNPQGPPPSQWDTRRMNRGGCYSSPTEYCRVSNRLSEASNSRHYIGFRLALDP